MMKKTVLLAIIAGLLLLGCSSNTQPPSSVSADHIIFDSDRTGNFEIYEMGADGSNITQITSDARYDSWWAKISPDRERIIFYRAPAGDHENYAKASLWQYDFGSSSLSLLREANQDGWIMQGHAEWSPNGKKLAMFGGVGPFLEIFVTDDKGKNPVQYTSRNGYNTDVSWSPDGTKLVFNGYPESDYSREKYEIYIMDARPYATPVRLTNDGYADYDPYVSPDGSRVAWLRNFNPTKGYIEGVGYLGDWAICVSNIDGSGQEYLIQDGNINSKPAWSQDGALIYFHRMEYDPLVEYKFGVFSINVSTRELQRLTSVNTGSNEYPVN
jgi:TolB protein